MARMFPENIEGYEKATEGEKRVFRFFREAARPHRDFTCWYEPSIGPIGLEPDFVLFSRKLGLLVVEVKDWAIHQIVSYTPLRFNIRVSGKVEKKTNPAKQARGYVHALMGWLKNIAGLLSGDAAYEGELRIPIGRMVVFPNISREQYLDRGLQWLIPVEAAMLGDDLHPAGEILRDSSGAKFQERVSGAFPFPFKGLAAKEEEKLCFALWPAAKIDLPMREDAGKARFQREVRALDEAQARVALRLAPGHQLVKGPPGSGKTLMLVHRCAHLYQFNAKAKKILLVCYNIALAGYLKRLLQEKGLGVGAHGVEVYHFYELCSRILGQPVHFENEEPEYYEVVTQETLEKLSRGQSLAGPFDAVLVDEGQDLDGEMLRVLLKLLEPGGDLVICLDEYQDVYRRKSSWKALGIQAAGRTRHLKRVYRNTKEIFDFTQRFIGQEPRVKKQLALLPEDLALRGDTPQILKFGSAEELENFILEDLKDCVARGEYRRSEIGIIYDDKVYGASRFSYDNRALPMRLLRNLETSGIPATWVSQDVRSKEMYDITTDRVSLISIHSSKGLDFDLVYLVGVDRMNPTVETMQNLVSLVYVAMTRAKYRLVVPYVEETVLIRRMERCLPAMK